METHVEVPAKGSPCGPKFKARYIMAVLASFGMGIIYGLKVALHVVIVAMVNNTAILSKHENTSVAKSKCGFEVSNTKDQPSEDGPFLWDANVQGLLLSSYFFGYLVAQIPGGRMAELLSAKWVMFFAVAINVVTMILSPVLAKVHYIALLVMRILQGIGGGVTFPACHVLLSSWAPPSERSFMSGLVYAGTSLGTVVFMLVSGMIAALISWEAVFYIEGAVSALWLIFWAWLVADSPSHQKLITLEERKYIIECLVAEEGPDAETRPPIPWKSVFRSLPFWAILVAHTCSNWGWYMVLIELPQYMKMVLEFELKDNALLTAMPFLTLWVFSLIISKILDVLREKNIMSTTWARKAATLMASAVPASCFLILCFIECNRILAVTLMTIAVTSAAGVYCGFLSNHIDIAPHYAGTLIAITNTVATIPGIVVPIVVGTLTHTDPTIASWRIIFYITIGLYIIEIVVYTIFGSGEVQAWNHPSTHQEPTETHPLKSK